MSPLTPRQVADASGFSLDTLRYYERIGLLDRIPRGAGGRRRYRDDDVDWLGVLRCLRDTGMPIADMRRYAQLARDGDHTVADRLDLLIDHDAHVEIRISELLSQRQHLREKIAYYRELLTAQGRV